MVGWKLEASLRSTPDIVVNSLRRRWSAADLEVRVHRNATALGGAEPCDAVVIDGLNSRRCLETLGFSPSRVADVQCLITRHVAERILCRILVTEQRPARGIVWGVSAAVDMSVAGSRGGVARSVGLLSWERSERFSLLPRVTVV